MPSLWDEGLNTPDQPSKGERTSFEFKREQMRRAAGGNYPGKQAIDLRRLNPAPPHAIESIAKSLQRPPQNQLPPPPSPPPYVPPPGAVPAGALRNSLAGAIIVGGGLLGLGIGKKIYEDASNPSGLTVAVTDYIQKIPKGKGVKVTISGGGYAQKEPPHFRGGQGNNVYYLVLVGTGQTRWNGIEGSSIFAVAIRIVGAINSVAFKKQRGNYDVNNWFFAVNGSTEYQQINFPPYPYSGNQGYFPVVRADRPTDEEWANKGSNGAWMASEPNVIINREDGTSVDEDERQHGNPPPRLPPIQIPITIDINAIEGSGLIQPPPPIIIHGANWKGWIFGGTGNGDPVRPPYPIILNSIDGGGNPPPTITPNVLGTGRSIRQSVTAPPVPKLTDKNGNLSADNVKIAPSLVSTGVTSSAIAIAGQIAIKNGQLVNTPVQPKNEIVQELKLNNNLVIPPITEIIPPLGVTPSVAPVNKANEPIVKPTEENKKGIEPTVQTDGGCCSATAAKLNTIDNKLGNLAGTGVELALLQKIDNKLGVQVPGGLSGWLGNFAKSIYLDKAINLANLVFTIHSSYMLSRNLVESTEELLTTVIQFVGTKMKNETLENFDVQEVIGTELQNTLQSILGKQNTEVFNDKMNKLNRILTSASNLLSSAESMFFSVTSILNMVGQNTGKIGNALVRSGTVLEDSYNKMQERYSMFFGKRFKYFDNYNQSIANSGEIVENLSSVAGEAISIDEQKDEIKTNFTEFKTAITDLKPETNLKATKVADKDAEKTEASKSPEIIPQLDNTNSEE